MMIKAVREAEKEEAREVLRKLLPPGSTVYTVVRHVSRSGMSRLIDCYVIQDGKPRWISRLVSKAAGLSFDEKKDAIRIGGCGMDMGFAIVYDLSASLYRKTGYKCLGKGKCPSNYHTNYRSTIYCRGTEGENGVPCFTDDKGVYRLRTGTGEEFALGEVCPMCKGKGGFPNPEGPERFDLVHTDGYALRHEWM